MLLIFYKISFLLGGIVPLLLGLLIYEKNKNEIVNKSYLGVSSCCALWSVGFFVLLFSKTVEEAYFWRMFMDTGAILIPAFWMHFVYALMGSNIKKRKEIMVYYFLAVFLIILNFADYIFPGIFIKEIIAKNVFNYYPTAGFGYYLFLLFYLITIPYSLYYLTISYFKSSGLKSQQIKYLIIASFIGFAGGGTTFLLTFNMPVAPYGVFFFPFYPIIVAFAVAKHHLFNIKFLISEFLTFIIWIFVIARISLSSNYREFWINGTLAFLVFATGILLLRSVSREIEMDRKLLQEAQKNLEFEQRLKNVYAEIVKERGAGGIFYRNDDKLRNKK